MVFAEATTLPILTARFPAIATDAQAGPGSGSIIAVTGVLSSGSLGSGSILIRAMTISASGAATVSGTVSNAMSASLRSGAFDGSAPDLIRGVVVNNETVRLENLDILVAKETPVHAVGSGSTNTNWWIEVQFQRVGVDTNPSFQA